MSARERVAAVAGRRRELLRRGRELIRRGSDHVAELQAIHEELDRIERGTWTPPDRALDSGSDEGVG